MFACASPVVLTCTLPAVSTIRLLCYSLVHLQQSLPSLSLSIIDIKTTLHFPQYLCLCLLLGSQTKLSQSLNNNPCMAGFVASSVCLYLSMMACFHTDICDFFISVPYSFIQTLQHIYRESYNSHSDTVYTTYVHEGERGSERV